MTRRPVAPIRSLPVLVAVTLACVVGLLLAAPTITQAANRSVNTAEDSSLRVELDSLSPLIPNAKSTLALAGTVTNQTDQPITGITVSLQISDSPISDRTSLNEIANRNVDPASHGIYDGAFSIAATLAPGASADWNLRQPFSALGLGNAGVYSIQLDANWDQDYAVSGYTRSFLPWFPDKKAVKPTQVVWLWPVSDVPNRDASQILLNDRTPLEVAPGGRLRRLLDIGLAAKTQPQWVVDPQVVETVDMMSRGYQVRTPTGATVTGVATQQAAEWMAKARAGLRTSTLYGMAYANPDVTAMTRSNLSSDVILATTTANETLGGLLRRPVPVGLGWPVGTRTDQATLDVLRTAGVRTVVLDSAAYPPQAAQEPTAFDSSGLIRTGAGPLSAVLTDRLLSHSFGSGDSSSADATAARQRFLAETAVMATNSPYQSTVVAVGPDAQWDPNPTVLTDLLATMQTAPWVRQAPLTSLLAKTPADSGRELAPMTKAARNAQLSRDYLTRVRTLQRRLAVFASVVVEPGTITEPFRAALLRASSAAWRPEPEEADLLVDQISSELNQQMARVRVLSSGTITFASNTGKVPITIANDLPRPVQVGIRLSADPSVRLVADPVETFTIPPNRKISTEVPAQVVGAGELPVMVQLTSPSGVSYGPPTQIVLRSTAYARAASWVVGIAFAVLALLLVANSVRRYRARHAAAPVPEPTPTEPGPEPTAGDTHE